MKNKKYVGITIGPIIKTILNARETGQIWGSSYIFSYLMKIILEEIKSKEICENLLTPYFEENVVIKGVGIFPDRAIFEAKNIENLKTKLDKIIENIYCLLSEKIGKEISEESDELKKFIEEYFQINYVIMFDLNNPIIEINKVLDSLELNNKIMSKNPSKDYLMELLKNKNVKKSFLAKEAEIENIHFRSVTEIAENGDNSDKKSSKYYAIVQSDGDNVEKLIKDLPENDIKDFSKKMFEYAKDSVSAINKFNGFPIYAGGDDLLFFAPLENNGKSIFDLINEISGKFEEKFNNQNDLTLSFGIAITYHKFPMYEGLKMASFLLFNKAKQFETDTYKKNAVAVKLIKHSGQTAEMLLNKNSDTYEEFIELINLKGLNKQNVKSMKNSFRVNSKIVDVLLDNNFNIKNYFDNTLKKEFHNENKEYIQKVIDFINKYNQEYKMTIHDVNNILEIKDFFLLKGDA